MFQESIWAMTGIDLAVVTVISYTLVFFSGLRNRILFPSIRFGLIAIGIGISAIAIFYLVDLASMHLFPPIMGEDDARAFMLDLHLQYSWFVMLISIGAISLGLLVTGRDLVRLFQDLRQSERRFRDLAESVSDWMWETGPDLRFTYFSERYTEISGFSPEDRIGTRREDFAAEFDTVENAAKWAAHLQDLQARRAFKNFEYASTATDNGHRYVSISGKPIFDANGDFLGYRGTGTDITERKLAEGALRDSEERYALAVAGANDGIWEMNYRTGELHRSPRWFELLGYDEDDLDPNIDAFGALIHPQDVYTMMRALDAHLNTGKPYDIEYRIRRKSGEYIWISAKGQAVWNSDGKPLRMAGSMGDISERKQAEEALQASEERFRSMFEGGAVGNIVIDNRGIIQDANSAAVRIFGHRLDEMRDRNVAMLMPAPDSGRHDGYIENYLKTGDAKIIGTGRQVMGLRKDGDRFPMHLAVAALHLGDHRAFLGSVTDLTEYKALESQLNRAHKMEAVGQLTGGIAHDFNNMLAITMANAQMLEDSLNGHEEELAMARSIVDASQRGAELTHRLLAFSRQQTLQSTSIGLGDLCKGMSDLLRRSLGETIDVEITADDDIWNVIADPGQVENALLNLSINASHAMPGGGNLTIRIQNERVTNIHLARHWEGRLGQYVAIRVTDTGTGMPPDVISKVFEPFFTTKEVGQGTGLGLSMVYGFAQQSGGFVIIESEEGTGTTVSILLPRARLDETTAPKIRATRTGLPRGKGETILLVEDDISVRESTAKILERLGYKALTADDGDSALEIFSNDDRIDLLLSDIVLPGGMNGIDLCVETRRQRPEQKCLFMSGYAASPDHWVPEGDELLPKPVALDDLAAKIRQILDA